MTFATRAFKSNIHGIWRFIVPACAALAILQGCSGGGSSGGGNSGTSYLRVSHDAVYFGTRDVGSKTTQTLTLTNQSGDAYPVNSVYVSGGAAEEFSLEFAKDEMLLGPGEDFDVALSFLPFSSGTKYSDLTIDHDIIVKTSDEKNQLEQRYYEAKQLERSRRYDESLEEYQEYIAGDPVTDNKRRASIKVPVLTESNNQGDTKTVRLYTAALDLREKKNASAAIQTLDQLLENNPDTYLADDALYLKGYIYLIDTKAYEDAYNTMLELRFSYPDSSYYDTALYIEAIAQKELGDNELAESLFNELRARHTGLTIDMFNLEWPKDNYISRLWFDRSSQALESLHNNS